jgi:molecular chaperone GrpE
VRTSTALELIPILDHFDSALKWKPSGGSEDVETWMQGVMQVRTLLLDALKTLGLEPFVAVGDPFDPHQHEAVEERVSIDQTPHTVMEVVRRGWKHSDRVVRPAGVILSTEQT